MGKNLKGKECGKGIKEIMGVEDRLGTEIGTELVQ